MKRLSILTVALLAGSATGLAQTAKTPVPAWLATSDDARATLRDGMQQAQESHKRIAVIYEGPWCNLCADIMQAVRTDPDLPKMESGFVGLHVPVEDFAALQQFAKTIRVNVPTTNPVLLTLLDSDGSLLTALTGPRLLTDGKFDMGKLKAAIGEFMPGAPAEEVFHQSLTRLESSATSGWVEFRADWCGWCKKMEKLFHDSEAAPILAKYYTVIAVDTEKNAGSEALSRRLGSKNGVDGIPWFAVIDAKGTVLATSEGPKGNIGFPDTDVEVAHFFSVLKQTAKGVTPAEIETITKALKAK